MLSSKKESEPQTGGFDVGGVTDGWLLEKGSLSSKVGTRNKAGAVILGGIIATARYERTARIARSLGRCGVG
jgi:hypothetical protein